MRVVLHSQMGWIDQHTSASRERSGSRSFIRPGVVGMSSGRCISCHFICPACHHPHHETARHRPPSVVRWIVSAGFCPPGFVRCKPSPGYRPPGSVRWVLSAGCCPPGVVRCKPSPGYRPPDIIRWALSAGFCPPGVIHCKASPGYHPLGTIRWVLSAGYRALRLTPFIPAMHPRVQSVRRATQNWSTAPDQVAAPPQHCLDTSACRSLRGASTRHRAQTRLAPVPSPGRGRRGEASSRSASRGRTSPPPTRTSSSSPAAALTLPETPPMGGTPCARTRRCRPCEPCARAASLRPMATGASLQMCYVLLCCAVVMSEVHLSIGVFAWRLYVAAKACACAQHCCCYMP